MRCIQCSLVCTYTCCTSIGLSLKSFFLLPYWASPFNILLLLPPPKDGYVLGWSVYLCVCVSVCVSVCLSVCLFGLLRKLGTDFDEIFLEEWGTKDHVFRFWLLSRSRSGSRNYLKDRPMCNRLYWVSFIRQVAAPVSAEVFAVPALIIMLLLLLFIVVHFRHHYYLNCIVDDRKLTLGCSCIGLCSEPVYVSSALPVSRSERTGWGILNRSSAVFSNSLWNEFSWRRRSNTPVSHRFPAPRKFHLRQRSRVLSISWRRPSAEVFHGWKSSRLGGWRLQLCFFLHLQCKPWQCFDIV